MLLYLGASVESIGYYAFLDCSSLTEIVLGSSVQTIGEYAFSRCTALQSITIGENVSEIGAWAFTYCNNLTNAYFGNTSGWSSNEDALTPSDLADSETAASYLRSQYRNYIWTRN